LNFDRYDDVGIQIWVNLFKLPLDMKFKVCGFPFKRFKTGEL
jgi:hypothetical protein